MLNVVQCFLCMFLHVFYKSEIFNVFCLQINILNIYDCDVCIVSYYNAESHSFEVERYSSTEPAYVDQVKMLFDDCGEKKYRVSDVAARSDRLQRAFIMLRVKVSLCHNLFNLLFYSKVYKLLTVPCKCSS